MTGVFVIRGGSCTLSANLDSEVQSILRILTNILLRLTIHLPILCFSTVT